MARIHTISDDETGIAVQVEADGRGVRRIVLECEADSILPRELIDALEPFIGIMPLHWQAAAPNAAPDPGEPATVTALTRRNKK